MLPLRRPGQLPLGSPTEELYARIDMIVHKALPIGSRMAVYARAGASGSHSGTVDDQVKKVTAHASERGLQVVATYTDVGGGSQVGPGLAEMIQAARGDNRAFSAVLADDAERVGRSVKIVRAVIDSLSEVGVSLWTIGRSGEIKLLDAAAAGFVGPLREVGMRTSR